MLVNLPMCTVLFFCGGDSSSEVMLGDRKRSDALLGRRLVDRQFQKQRLKMLIQFIQLRVKDNHQEV